jgi:hypothetical protein
MPKDNPCDRNYFYCWQKTCGDLEQIKPEFLPERMPGCKIMDHPTKSSKRHVDVKRTIICVCDTDFCNSGIVDLTGESVAQPVEKFSHPEMDFKILDRTKMVYRQPDDWERVFLMDDGHARDKAIADIFESKYATNLTRFEPGISHDLEDTSFKVTVNISNCSHLAKNLFIFVLCINAIILWM